MKNHLLSLLFVSVLGCIDSHTQPMNRLSLIVNSLEGMSSMEFTAYYDINQEGFTMADTTEVYLEKSTTGGLLPIKYVFKSNTGDLQFFDGSSFHNIMINERTIIKTDKPPSYQVVSNSGLLFSPFYVSSVVNYLLENDREKIQFVKDSSMRGMTVGLFEIKLDYIYLLDGSIVRNGDLLPNQMKAENIQKKYVIGIDNEISHPVFIREIFSESDYIEVMFSPIQESNTTFEMRSDILQNEAFLELSIEEYM